MPERPVNCEHAWVRRHGDVWICNGGGCDLLFAATPERVVPTWERCEHNTPRGLGCWLCESAELNKVRSRVAELEAENERLKADMRRTKEQTELGWRIGALKMSRARAWARAWKRAAKDNRRRKRNLQASHHYPRVEDVVAIKKERDRADALQRQRDDAREMTGVAIRALNEFRSQVEEFATWDALDWPAALSALRRLVAESQLAVVNEARRAMATPPTTKAEMGAQAERAIGLIERTFAADCSCQNGEHDGLCERDLRAFDTKEDSPDE